MELSTERKNRTLIEAARTISNRFINTLLFLAEAVRNGPNWLFDIDALTISMNYKPVVAGNQTNGNAGTKENIDAGLDGKKIVPDQNEVPNTEEPRVNQEQDANVNNTNNINTVSPTVNAADIENNVVDENIVYGCIDDPNMPNLEEIVYSDDDEEVGAEADMNNLATNVPVSPIPTTRVHKDHPLEQIIRDIHSAPQTRRMTKNVTEHGDPSLTDPNWIEAIQDDFCNLNSKGLDSVDLPKGKGLSELNGCEECLFIWVILKRRVLCQPPGFEDRQCFPDKVYKVEKALYGLHQDPRAWYETLSTYLLENGFRRGIIDKTLFIKKDKDYAQKIPDEFNGGAYFLFRIASTIEGGLNLQQPDIMFAVCACARFQITPKVSHLHVVKRIFRYLKGQPKLGLWYPRDSPFDLEAFFDSDYAGASLDRKSTTGVALIEGRMIAMDWRCFLDEIKVNTGISKISTARIGKAVWLDLFLTFIHGLYLVVSSVLVMNRGMLLYSYWRKS
ncbi:putative ribonuclease H-like domain-containing protein [Tanacetum coccineum]